MLLLALGAMLLLTSDAPRSHGVLTIVAVVAAVAVLEQVVAFVAWAWLGRRDGDEPGASDDGGGGQRRTPPRTPPPEPLVSWPDFERQFAEYVAARPREADRAGARR